MFPHWSGWGSQSGWTGGGNDYAGCIGAQNAYTNPTTSNAKRQFCGPDYVYDQSPNGMKKTGVSGKIICTRGVFVPNRATRFNDITDGLTNTIAIGEVPRAQSTDNRDSYWAACHTHIDGWAVAGPNTLFDTTRAGSNDVGQLGGFNNDYFESAGSDHVGGAHFGMADGSVQWLIEDINSAVYANLGCIGDGELIKMPY
jgi:hypothetical protein